MEGIMLNLIVFGPQKDDLTLLSYAEKPLQYKYTDDYDDFLSYLSEEEPQAVFILADGAIGMEGVIAVKNFYPMCPVVWISNDKGFGIQSYRLGCVFFAEKPLTERTTRLAFQRVKQSILNSKPAQENRFAHLDTITISKICYSQNAEELIQTAKKHGVTVSKEEADNYFRYLTDIRCGELDDDALGQVHGGTNVNHFKLFFDSAQELPS
jgi:hypothetical protein